MSQRILNIIQAPTWGGLHGLVARVAPYCQELGWETHVAVASTDNDLAGRLERAGCVVHQLPIGRLRRSANPLIHTQTALEFRTDTARLKRLIRSVRPDVVQVNGIHHVHGVFAARTCGVPIAWALHSDQAPLPVRFGGAFLVRWLSASILMSGDKLARHYPAIKRRSNSVPFHAPVDQDLFRPCRADGADLRTSWTHDKSAVVFGTIGGRGPNKNHSQLVEAFGLAHAEVPNTSLVIGGPPLVQHEGWYRTEVLERIDNMPPACRDAIFIDHPGDRVPQFLNAYDVFVLTSKGEGASLAIGEAMAVGLPVIANDVGSVASTVVDGETGWLNRSRSTEELAGQMLAAATNPELRSRYGQNARAVAKRLLTPRSCAASHVEAFELAVSQR